MLDALGNIFRIPELRQKIIFTLIMFAVFRMGTHIPVPGVDPSAIEQLFAQGTLFGLLDLFSGGAFSKFSVFAMHHALHQRSHHYPAPQRRCTDA